jgi:hypothetical protein
VLRAAPRAAVAEWQVAAVVEQLVEEAQASPLASASLFFVTLSVKN